MRDALTAHFTRVYKHLYRLTRSEADAEDLTQEVFLRLWRSPPDLAGCRASLSTWLYRVATNLFIDWYRRRKPETPDESIDVAAGEPGPETIMAHKQVSGAVAQALSNLPVRQCAALSLTYYEGLSNKEAAEVLEISVEALESLLSRARRALKGDLAREWRDMIAVLEKTEVTI